MNIGINRQVDRRARNRSAAAVIASSVAFHREGLGQRQRRVAEPEGHEQLVGSRGSAVGPKTFPL